MTSASMFDKPKRIKSDTEGLESVYEVQWKTPGNDEDKEKIIGILETPDTNLDWNTFKSYLIQNSGNMRLSTDDIKISYIDSDDDIIPVDSELEFRECLKFSKARAKRGRRVTLRVSAVPEQSPGTGARPRQRCDQAPSNTAGKQGYKVLRNTRDLMNLLHDNGTQDPTPEREVKPPAWFLNYMTQFKKEVVEEVTKAVVKQQKSTMKTELSTAPSDVGSAAKIFPLWPTQASHKHHREHMGHLLDKRKKKKKISEEDSSDCTDALPLSEEKLEFLRDMQKIRKKKLDAELEKLESKTKKIMEKKKKISEEDSSDCTDGLPLQCEGKSELLRDLHKIRKKKLDAKLEKLESKTKKIMEKKAEIRVQKSSCLAMGECTGGKRRQCTARPNPMMDALPVDMCNHMLNVRPGEIVTQSWKVVNNGQLPWTEYTELRFAWGSTSLVPVAVSVKCPPLMPGETGNVKVKLQAPTAPGNYECYWNFQDCGRRFGHWLGCTVTVQPHEIPSTPPREIPSAPPLTPDLLDTAVDLSVKCTAPVLMQETLVESVEINPEDSDLIADHKDLPKCGNNITCDLLNIKESPKSLNSMGNDDTKIENVTKSVANMTIYGVPEEWKNDVIPALEPQDKTGEYDSASDSDNISVISGTISIDSDTEPSEEFVVIPMPQCFNCEQALNEPVSNEPLPESDNNNNMELKPYPQMQMFLPDLRDDSAQGQESGFSEGEADEKLPQDKILQDMETESKTENKTPEEKKPEEKIPEDDHDPNNVYVRDSQGRAIPVAKVLRDAAKAPPFSVKVSVSHNTFGDPSVGHGPNGPRFPFGPGTEPMPPPPPIPPHCQPNFRPGHQFCTGNATTSSTDSSSSFNSSCHCPLNGNGHTPFFQHWSSGARFETHVSPPPPHQTAQAPPSPPHRTSQPAPPPPQRATPPPRRNTPPPRRNTPPHTGIHTEQPRSYQHTRPTGYGVNSGTNSRETSPPAGVQILPATLVTGAVNVASSAINTARTVIDMLVPKREEAEPQPMSPLRQLEEMGFTNRELNLILLRRHNNDLSRVIADLLR